MKSLNKFLILSFFIFSIPSIGLALPECGNTLHNCTGTYTWENGDEYDGDWKNNKKHGKGRYTWKSGSKYEGDWVNGKRTGEGVLTFANGKKQEGVFKDSKFLYSKKIDKPKIIKNELKKKMMAKALQIAKEASEKAKINFNVLDLKEYNSRKSVGWGNTHPAIKFIVDNPNIAISTEYMTGFGSFREYSAIEASSKCKFKIRRNLLRKLNLHKKYGEVEKLFIDFNKINWKSKKYNDGYVTFSCKNNCTFYFGFSNDGEKTIGWNSTNSVTFLYEKNNNYGHRLNDALHEISRVCNAGTSRY